MDLNRVISCNQNWTKPHILNFTKYKADKVEHDEVK